MKPHPWFESPTGVVIMSHHGRVSRKDRAGTVGAMVAAYRLGYRWFQIDVVPIKDDLISLHAVLGRRPGFRRLTHEQAKEALGYPVSTLRELLDHSEMPDARWNIEVKSRTALPALIKELKRSMALDRVMVSAPVHPRIVREVRETFGDLVAVSAPVNHGGIFGRTFTLPKLDPDGMQVHRWFGQRARRVHGNGPTRVQSWTIGKPEHLEACIAAACDPVVKNSDVETRERLRQMGKWPELDRSEMRGWGAPAAPDQDARVARRPPTPEHPATEQAVPTGAVSDQVTGPTPDPLPPDRLPPDRLSPEIEVLMLGGGGWRGAFGSIGSLAYLESTGRWRHVRHVVGLSGGSFVAGALGAKGVDDDQPWSTLARLTREMVGLKWRMRAAMAGLVLPFAVVAALVWWWTPMLLLAPTILLYLSRLVISIGWRRMLKRLFDDAGPRDEGRRRYVVCATGRSSARPHFFVTGDLERLQTDSSRKGEDWGRVVPAGWTWTDAVVSSTALPWVNGYRTVTDRAKGRAGKGEVLIDGGVVGIFGRQWFDQALLGTSPGDSKRTLAIDTGRKHRTGGRLTETITSLSTVGLLSRWVQIALDASFRKEIERADRAENEATSGRVVMNLVRVAETDVGDHHDQEARWHEVVRRLEHGRCIVRRFGLVGLSERNCLTTVTVAVVACIVDIEGFASAEHVQQQLRDIEERLREIGAHLEVGDALAAIWEDL